MRNNSKAKRKIREDIALEKIQKPILINSNLLEKQLRTLINLTSITNDEIGDHIFGVENILETFACLPKGEYHIIVKIECGKYV